MKIYFALAALMPSVALAAGPFDGNWKQDADSFQFSGKPLVFELKDGVYKCIWCAPPYSVKADGADHKVVGDGYFNSAAVRVVDAHSVEVAHKLDGKPTFAYSMVVSADGKTLTGKFTDTTGSEPSKWTEVMSRTAVGPAGSHVVAGSWKVEKVPDMSDTGSIITYKMAADGLQMQWNGQSYDAKFDGKKYLIANDPGKTWVSLKRISNDSVEETDSRNGKVTDVIRSTVSADGRTMTVVDDDKAHGTTMQFKMTKQP
jgi:hypothetical protein